MWDRGKSRTDGETLSTRSEKMLSCASLQTLVNNGRGKDRGSYRRPITKATRTKAWDEALNAHWEKKEGGVRGKGTHSKASNFSPLHARCGCGLVSERKDSCEGVSFILRSLLDNADTEVFCSWKPVGIEAYSSAGRKKEHKEIITPLWGSCSLPPLWHLLLLTVMEDQREPIRKVSTSICRASLIPNWIKHSAIMF